MSIFNIFRRTEKSANIARDRLKMILVHERNQGRSSRFDITGLQKKIIQVIADHLGIQESDFSVDLQQATDGTKLELNVTLPEEV